MDPGACVAAVVRDVALQGPNGASLAQMWNWAERASGQPLDGVLRTLAWSWICRHPSIVVTERTPRQLTDVSSQDDLTTEPLESILSRYPDLRVYATAEEQWRELAGRPRGSIGGLSWALLCCVARHGAEGLTAIELRQETGQDARSIHGRLATLEEMSLVKKFPVSEHGTSTTRIILSRFVQAYPSSNQPERVSADGWNHVEIARRLVDLCKTGPNGIRLVQDVLEELGFRSIARGPQRFRALVRRLSVRGYVRRVSVFEPSDPGSQFRCIQFLKDYPSASMELDVAEEEEEEEEEDEDEEVSAEAAEEEKLEQRPTDLGSMVVASYDETAMPLANIYFSIAHQVYDFVAAAGTSGIKAMDIYRQITGPKYMKFLSRILDELVAKPKTGPLGYLGLVRATDFEGRTKFYRYFTRVSFASWQKKSCDPQWGSFQTIGEPKKASLWGLELEYAEPLPGSVAIMRNYEGHEWVNFQGEKSNDQSGQVVVVSTGILPRRRGRPRKDALGKAKPQTKEAKSHKFSTTVERTWLGGTPASPGSPSNALSVLESMTSNPLPQGDAGSPDTHLVAESLKEDSTPVQYNSVTAPHELAISLPQKTVAATHSNFDFENLARLKRKEMVLEVIKKAGGIVEGGNVIQKLVNERYSPSGSGAPQIDRRTMNRTISSLVAMGDLKQKTVLVLDDSRTRHLLVLPEINSTDPRVVEASRNLQPRHSRPGSASSQVPLIESEIEILSGLYKPKRYSVLGENVKKISGGGRRKFGPSAAEISTLPDSNVSPVDLPRALNSVIPPKPKKRGRPRKQQQPITPMERENQHLLQQLPSNLDTDVSHEANMHVDPELVDAPEIQRTALDGHRPLLQDDSAVLPRIKSERVLKRPAPETTPFGQPESHVVLNDDTILHAVIVARELYGRGQQIPWNLVAEVAPGMPLKLLKRRWATLRSTTKNDRMEKLKAEFGDLMVISLAQGKVIWHKQANTSEFPGLKYYLEFWQHARDSGQIREEASERLFSRVDWESRHGSIRGATSAAMIADPLEQISNMTSFTRIEETFVSTPLGIAKGAPIPRDYYSDFELRMRAIMATDKSTYESHRAAEELADINEVAASQTLDRLVQRRIAQYLPKEEDKHLPGLTYGLHERILAALAPKLLSPTQADAAAENAHSWITKRLTSHKKEIPPAVNDTLLVPLIEAVAQFNTVLLTAELPQTGRLSTHYRSRLIDKDILDGRLYAELRADARAAMPTVCRPLIDRPLARSNNRPFIWQSRGLTCNEIWRLILCRICTVILFRPGIPLVLLSNMFNGVLSSAEVEAAVEYLIARGNLRGDCAALFTAAEWFVELS